METKNLVSNLQLLNAKHAKSLSTSGTAVQRLSALAGGGVAVGTVVMDQVTGQKVEVLSAGVAYMPEEVLSEVPTVRK
jgi:hypothetical protein